VHEKQLNPAGRAPANQSWKNHQMVPEGIRDFFAASAGVAGVFFVAAALLSLVRLRQVRWATVRDAIFLVGLVVVFVLQLMAGLAVNADPADSGDVNTIAVLVVCCFLIGIARAWELIGGPSVGIAHEVTALVRSHGRAEVPGGELPGNQAPADGQPPAPAG